MRQSHLLKGESSGQNDTRASKMDDKMKRGTSLSQINDDAMEEIFSRLSAKDISLSKCVCTKWNGIMSHNSFIHRYCQRSDSISGLFLQQHEEIGNLYVKPVLHFPLATKNPQIQTKFLDFLPEKVYVMSSNNGLLCCRSLVSINKLDRPGGIIQGGIHYGYIPKIYVCNPISKEFTVINPSQLGHVGKNIGLAFDPVSCNFHLVTIDCDKQLDLSWQYSFTVFSSKTSTWRILDAVFNWDSPIHRNKSVFVHRIFHWLATNHHVITFDLEKEAVGVVNLPGPIMEGEGYHGVCIGSSGERLAYIVVHPLEFRVWILKDYGKSEWFLENRLPLDQFYEENKSLLRRQLFFLLTKDKNNPETQTNGSVIPLAFGGDVLYMVMNRFMYSYEFKTRDLKKWFFTIGMKCDMTLSPTVVPYAANLIAMDFLKAKPRTGTNGADS
ncbi:F-box protein At5g49610-like [Impatiens glandulifera]|uniref:F-box protein At5g49610-like n=1 Tax=Impatiens glandulifera TaxID=253017 RepID=UPI001FB177C6|nr:F-box protein At5g49610-like [Impatiens glandulifera]